MAKRIEITEQHAGAPDHINTRLYRVGDVYEVGSPEMPQALADKFLANNWAKEAVPRGRPPASGSEQK